MKANQVKMGTLMNYVVRQCEVSKTLSDVLALPTSLAHCIGAAAIDFGQLEGDARKVAASVKMTRKELDKMSGNDIHPDFATPFIARLTPFVEKAEGLVAKMEADLASTKKASAAAAGRFGAKVDDNSGGDPIMGFFGVFKTLCAHVAAAEKAEEKRKEDAERAEKKELEKKAREVARAKKADDKKTEEKRPAPAVAKPPPKGAMAGGGMMAAMAAEAAAKAKPKDLFHAFDQFNNGDTDAIVGAFEDGVKNRLESRRGGIVGSDDEEEEESGWETDC